jgi:hypothetical protein
MFDIIYQRVANPPTDREGRPYTSYIERYHGDDIEGMIKKVRTG